MVRIKKLLYWLPIVWKTGDWDAFQAVYFFMLKLAEVRKTIDKNRRHVGDAKKVRRMWELEQILKRILQEPGAVSYDAQYTKDELIYTTEFSPIEDSELWRAEITSPSDKECVLLPDDGFARMKHSQMLFRQDIDFCALYMKKYLEGWWD
jgi:hypothetical protein